MNNLNPNDPEQLAKAVLALSGWEIIEGYLSKEFIFNDFRQAFAFMSDVAVLAEEQQHHPDWSNCYKTVLIKLRTHEEDAITMRDVSLAAAIENIEF